LFAALAIGASSSALADRDDWRYGPEWREPYGRRYHYGYGYRPYYRRPHRYYYRPYYQAQPYPYYYNQAPGPGFQLRFGW
jgi:hypothetical protein